MGHTYISGGLYFSAKPKKGGVTGIDLDKNDVPSEGKIVGDWHTHGDYSVSGRYGIIRTSMSFWDGFNSDHFSSGDIAAFRKEASKNSRYEGFLGTPRKVSEGWSLVRGEYKL